MAFDQLMQFVQAVAVVVGVVFGLVQLRQLRRQRETQAAIELLGPLQLPDTAAAILRIFSLPDGLNAAALKAELGSDFDRVVALAAAFESLGPLVARGHVPIEMYAEFYRGATIVCWNKLSSYVKEQRAAGWNNLFEWLQWLAERMNERASPERDIAAHERFRDWRSDKDFDRLARKA